MRCNPSWLPEPWCSSPRSATCSTSSSAGADEQPAEQHGDERERQAHAEELEEPDPNSLLPGGLHDDEVGDRAHGCLVRCRVSARGSRFSLTLEVVSPDAGPRPGVRRLDTFLPPRRFAHAGRGIEPTTLLLAR